MNPMNAHTNPHQQIIDPRQAVILSEAASQRRGNAQELARKLLRENAALLKTLGMVLERVGPVELDEEVRSDETILYEVQRYDAHDGRTCRWVGKRQV